MDMYSISPSELEWDEFGEGEGEGRRDEGIVLGLEEDEGTEMDDLQILKMAFQSRLPLVTPSPRTVAAFDDVKSRGRRQSLIGRRIAARKETGDSDMNWLGPLITTSSLMAGPALGSPPPRPLSINGNQHKLRTSTSVPNLRHSASTNEGNVAPLPPLLLNRGRKRGSTLSSTPELGDIVDLRARKSGVLRGTFGALRDAFGGSTRKRR